MYHKASGVSAVKQSGLILQVHRSGNGVKVHLFQPISPIGGKKVNVSGTGEVTPVSALLRQSLSLSRRQIFMAVCD